MTALDLQPLDLILTSPRPEDLSWKHPTSAIVSRRIQSTQRSAGYKWPAWEKTHVRLYFSEDRIFSCTTPACRWDIWRDVERLRYEIYRPRFLGSPDDLHWNDVRWFLYGYYAGLIGSEYDIFQLIVMDLHERLGVDADTYHRLDSKRLYVCSTAIAIGYHMLENENLLARSSREVAFSWRGEVLHDQRVMPAHLAAKPFHWQYIGGWNDHGRNVIHATI